MAQRILIIGGGFGGVVTAQQLSKKRLKDTEIVLMTDKPWLEYYGVLYRLLTGGSPAEACIPLKMILPGNVHVLIDRAESVDPVGKTVRGESSAKHSYDTLILAPGSEPAYFNIPGMQEHSYGMQSVKQALALRMRVEECIASMQGADDARKATLGHFMVIGAGPTGVEIAGEMLPHARELAQKAGVDPSLIRVDLVEAMDRVLPIVAANASAKVLKRLKSLGVNVLLNTAVESADAKTVKFKGGETVNVSTIIWTAGVKASGLLSKVPGLELDRRGRAVVDEQLRAKGVEGIFVVGDCAVTPYAGLAQTAVEDGIFVARVIDAQNNGQNLPVYHAKIPDYAIPAGPFWAAVKYKFIRAYGIPGFILRRAADFHVYSLVMPWKHIYAAFFGKIPLKKYGIEIS
jgi:NADH dehydrogenase